jgi:threonylcarbamoyladenosine tRNA methylthiotransferase MtaB
MNIVFETLGCKLNQAETENLGQQLECAGHHLVDSVEEADMYILNTCTVTATADAKSRHLLRMACRRNPAIKLVATGCYAQNAPGQLAGLEGVHLVIGNNEKELLAKIIEEAFWSELPATQKTMVNYEHRERTRSFIKIQDGCSKFCSYCIVPLVRGSEKSVTAGRILNEIQEKANSGFKEVVLTGTEVGAYNDNSCNLKQLLENILSETDIPRLRLSSLQPQEISEELIGLWRDKRLCPHFHLSLQSGSDSVLTRMRRLYSVSQYTEAINTIRKELPEAAVTTDVIAGFPGETEQEFQDSYKFCRQMEFARIHVFPFSARAGTTASEMSQRVPEVVKKERSRKFLELAKNNSKNYVEKFSGKIMDVLWEQQSRGMWLGYTGNYIRVYTKNGKDLSNRILSARLGERRGEGLWGYLPED